MKKKEAEELAARADEQPPIQRPAERLRELKEKKKLRNWSKERSRGIG
jgi:hypothetical protein